MVPDKNLLPSFMPDDGTGVKTIWRVENMDLVKVVMQMKLDIRVMIKDETHVDLDSVIMI